MIVGIPKETKRDEYRVAMLPVGVEELVRAGHEVLVERSAGAGSGLPDEAYSAAGGRLVVATLSDAQREFVQSLGFGDAVRGVVSLEEIRRKEGADFDWPEALPATPDAKRETGRFKE